MRLQPPRRARRRIAGLVMPWMLSGRFGEKRLVIYANVYVGQIHGDRKRVLAAKLSASCSANPARTRSGTAPRAAGPVTAALRGARGVMYAGAHLLTKYTPLYNK